MGRCSSCLPYVRRYGIASLELDHVTWHYFCRRNDFCVAPSNGSCSRGTQGPQGVHGLLGLELLDKAHDDVEDNDGGDDPPFNVRTDAKADGHGHDQDLHPWIRLLLTRQEYGGLNQHHGVGDLANHDLDGLYAWAFIQLVATIFLQTGVDFGNGKAIVGIDSEFIENSMVRESMGRPGERLVGLSGDMSVAFLVVAHLAGGGEWKKMLWLAAVVEGRGGESQVLCTLSSMLSFE